MGRKLYWTKGREWGRREREERGERDLPASSERWLKRELAVLFLITHRLKQTSLNTLQYLKMDDNGSKILAFDPWKANYRWRM